MSPRKTLGRVLLVIGVLFIIVSFLAWILPSSNIMGRSLIPSSSLAGVLVLVGGTVLPRQKA